MNLNHADLYSTYVHKPSLLYTHAQSNYYLPFIVTKFSEIDFPQPPQHVF